MKFFYLVLFTVCAVGSIRPRSATPSLQVLNELEVMPLLEDRSPFATRFADSELLRQVRLAPKGCGACQHCLLVAANKKKHQADQSAPQERDQKGIADHKIGSAE